MMAEMSDLKHAMKLDNGKSREVVDQIFGGGGNASSGENANHYENNVSDFSKIESNHHHIQNRSEIQADFYRDLPGGDSRFKSNFSPDYSNGGGGGNEGMLGNETKSELMHQLERVESTLDVFKEAASNTNN